MRRWLLLGAAVLVVGAAAIAYALARLNGYLITHRDELATWASQAVGRPLSFASIGVSLRGGGSARITDLRVADDRRFGDGDFLRAASAIVSVSLLDAARGQLRVRTVVIDSPSLALSRDAGGWNFDSLAPLRAPAAAAGTPGPHTPTAPAPAVAPLLIESVRLRDGTVVFSDRERQPPTALTIDRVDLTLSQPATGAPIHLRGSAALFAADTHNATIDGTITPGVPATADVHAHWDPVPLTELRAVVPTLGEFAVGGRVGGDLHFAGAIGAANEHLRDLLAALSGSLDLQGLAVQLPAIALPIADLSGSVRLSPDVIELSETTARLGDTPVAVTCRLAPPATGVGQCRLTAASVDLRPLGRGDGVLRDLTVDASAPPFDPDPMVQATIQVADGQLRDAAFRQLNASATLRDGMVEIERASVEVSGGSAQASGRCTDTNGASPRCSATLSLQNVQIAAALAGLRSGAAQRVDGRLDADLQLSANGRQVADLRHSARGTGSVRVANGVVQGVNLAQRVLGTLPGVDRVIRSGGRAARVMGGGATHFNRLTATLRIADQRVASDDVSLTADEFSVDGEGSVGFAGELAARGTFRGSAPLIDDLSGGLPLLGTLVASTKGIITIPFTVRGTVRDPRVEPDLTGVATGIGRDAGAGLKALFGAPEAARGRPGGVLRQGLDKLFGH